MAFTRSVMDDWTVPLQLLKWLVTLDVSHDCKLQRISKEHIKYIQIYIYTIYIYIYIIYIYKNIYIYDFPKALADGCLIYYIQFMAEALKSAVNELQRKSLKKCAIRL